MPFMTKTLASRSSWLISLAAAALTALPLPAPAQQKPAPADADSFYGKEPTEGVYVRDSAGAVEKLTLAQKMERLKEWSKSADLYQEVIIKYADRVVSSRVNKENVIYQYTSIINRVQEQHLAKWPQEGLDVYRARFEAPAQALLDSAGPTDVAALNKVYSLYFVTEAGKQAGIRLIDLYLESGEFPAAAWLGDRLLTLQPGLIVERSAVLYRTALAYYYGGDEDKAKERLEQLKSRFPGDRGTVRGKDVILADSLAEEMKAPVAHSQSASADSWPMPFGDPSRSRVSTAEGRPGARLYGIELSRPAWPNIANNVKDQLQKLYEDSISDGDTLGILPVTDRGELFFQDGQRLYGLSIESGVPLPGWTQTYASGTYVLPGVWGSPRAHQLSVALTDHEVLAIMGQPDLQGRQAAGLAPAGEAKLICLDRQSGREKWNLGLSQLPETARDARALQLTGSPLVVGDSVLVIARGSKAQFEDCYVLGFELSTGRFRWSTYIASASSGVNIWNGMGTTQDADNASHMAYANGRVYVQTNLGALAALDAYTGAVAWLDIYKTGRQAVERQPFNQFVQGTANMAPPHKPWAFNPVIVEDGYVFTLPTAFDEHGIRNLMIYDAETGVEVKEIDVMDIERKIPESNRGSFNEIDTLLGVIGDRLLLSGNKGVICLNWKKYTKEEFNPEHDNITCWIEPLPQPILGRGFLTRESLYVPCSDRLFRIQLSKGRPAKQSDSVYPIYPQTWEEPQEPGNILATNDHVVIAGAKWVNVYTDLTLAKSKLDRELAASPEDPQPRLRYAEVMFVAGEPEAAVVKLDEAANLLGGLKSLQPGVNRDRFFNDALTFAKKLAKAGAAEERERVMKLFDRAGAAASTPVQQVHYRQSRAQFCESLKDYAAAVQLYQEILSDAQMRPVPMVSDDSIAPVQADSVATKAIAAIIRDHPAAYESFEQAAAAAMEQAQASKEDSAGKLLEVARTYPNSAVAGKAMIAAAEMYETAGDPRHAIRVLRDMWFMYPQSSDKPRMLESMARNYLVMASAPRRSAGDSGPMEKMEAAAAALARATLAGDPKLDKPLTLRDGTIIPAGTPIAQALETVRKYRGAEVAKALPDLHVEIPPKIPRHPRPKAFLAPNPARDVIPNIKALVLPAREFARADRIVAFTVDGVLDIFAAGQTKPLAVSHAITDEPKACAWLGDELLVWSASQVVSIKAASGEQIWKIDLHRMDPIEVVHIRDTAQVMNPGVDPNQVVFNGGRPIRVGAGQQVFFRPPRRLGMMINPQPAAAPVAAGAEEVIEVHPVGDHVLVTTSSGRILSADAASGQISWQTRLSDRPVDRLVANEDFTVVKVSDEAAVRIAAFDTATGQMRCTRAWVVQSAMVPVNLALAGDGTLVYTMPNSLCLKDLYKPWGDPTDKENQGKPNLNLRIFDRANQPDQLVIAEGRILAFAVEGTMKFVHVFSLETGQAVMLHFNGGQGDQGVENRLKAGKTDQVSLRVVGSHLYVVSTVGVISYNLDRPSETWEFPAPLEPDVVAPSPTVREAFIGQKFLTLLVEPPHAEEVGAPVPLGGIAPAAIPANGAAAQPDGVAPPIHECRLELFARYPVSDKNPKERGNLEYRDTIIDPAGITPTWQVADGGLYYLAADNTLHILRGNEK